MCLSVCLFFWIWAQNLWEPVVGLCGHVERHRQSAWRDVPRVLLYLDPKTLLYENGSRFLYINIRGVPNILVDRWLGHTHKTTWGCHLRLFCLHRLVLCAILFWVFFFFYVLFLSHKTDLMGQTQRTTSLTLKLDHLQNFRDRTISIELYFLKGMTQTTSIGRKYFIERRQPWSLV